MAQINQVVVTNTTKAGATWPTNQEAIVSGVGNPVYVSATAADGPPAAFLDATDVYQVNGVNVVTGVPFASGNVNYDAAQSNPPKLFVFS